jgi:hypothetical protein
LDSAKRELVEIKAQLMRNCRVLEGMAVVVAYFDMARIANEERAKVELFDKIQRGHEIALLEQTLSSTEKQMGENINAITLHFYVNREQ